MFSRYQWRFSREGKVGGASYENEENYVYNIFIITKYLYL